MKHNTGINYFTYTYCIFVLILFAEFSCQSEMSLSEKNIFLEEIYHRDQDLRIKANSLPESSQLYKQIWDSIRISDKKNLIEILDYLDNYGYPDTLNFSKNANIVPWCVLQHNSDLEVRQKYSHWLIEANKMGNLEDGKLWVFLHRFYIMKYNDIHEVDNTFENNYAERIPILIEALEIK